jgi:hypothetical protein
MNGGKRPGGGRKAGSKNKLTQAREQAMRQAAKGEEGLSPLDLFLMVMRDKKQPIELRLDAAKNAAPYVHRRQPQDVKHEGLAVLPQPVVLIHTAPEMIPMVVPPDGPAN